MSIFETERFECPQCEAVVEFELSASVNADRRPDLRDAILADTFQQGTCSECEFTFRAEPRFTYFDFARSQWILAKPAEDFANWSELEQIAQETFDLAYGPNASAAAQEMGRALTVRVVFGWPSVREKILCAETGLEDVNLELLKLVLIRGLEQVPLADDVELRLQQVTADELELRWLQTSTARPLESIRISREAYDQIAASPDTLSEVSEQLQAGPFVDLNRLLVPATDDN